MIFVILCSFLLCYVSCQSSPDFCYDLTRCEQCLSNSECEWCEGGSAELPGSVTPPPPPTGAPTVTTPSPTPLSGSQPTAPPTTVTMAPTMPPAAPPPPSTTASPTPFVKPIAPPPPGVPSPPPPAPPPPASTTTPAPTPFLINKCERHGTCSTCIGATACEWCITAGVCVAKTATKCIGLAKRSEELIDERCSSTSCCDMDGLENPRKRFAEQSSRAQASCRPARKHTACPTGLLSFNANASPIDMCAAAADPSLQQGDNSSVGTAIGAGTGGFIAILAGVGVVFFVVRHRKQQSGGTALRTNPDAPGSRSRSRASSASRGGGGGSRSRHRSRANTNSKRVAMGGMNQQYLAAPSRPDGGGTMNGGGGNNMYLPAPNQNTMAQQQIYAPAMSRESAAPSMYAAAPSATTNTMSGYGLVPGQGNSGYQGANASAGTTATTGQYQSTSVPTLATATEYQAPQFSNGSVAGTDSSFAYQKSPAQPKLF